MEFEIFHQQSFINSPPFQDIAVSNLSQLKPRFLPKSGEIIISGKSYTVPDFNQAKYSNYKIYVIDSEHIILQMEKYRLVTIFYLIEIKEDDISFEYFEGLIVYVGKSGFIRSLNNFLDSEIFDFDYTSEITVTYQSYNVITKKWSSCEFHSIEEKIHIIRKYFISIYDTSKKYLNHYVVPFFWFEDFKRYNPDFPNIEKNYFQKKPQELNFISESDVLVHFKDEKLNLPFLELKELESDFINEQLKENNIYLESFTYQEYKDQTYEFLDYINSYILHIYLKEKMIDDFNMLL